MFIPVTSRQLPFAPPLSVSAHTQAQDPVVLVLSWRRGVYPAGHLTNLSFCRHGSCRSSSALFFASYWYVQPHECAGAKKANSCKVACEIKQVVLNPWQNFSNPQKALPNGRFCMSKRDVWETKKELTNVNFRQWSKSTIAPSWSQQSDPTVKIGCQVFRDLDCCCVLSW